MSVNRSVNRSYSKVKTLRDLQDASSILFQRMKVTATQLPCRSSDTISAMPTISLQYPNNSIVPQQLRLLSIPRTQVTQYPRLPGATPIAGYLRHIESHGDRRHGDRLQIGARRECCVVEQTTTDHALVASHVLSQQ